MSYRLHAVKVVSRRRIMETLISPGLYITLSISLLLSFFLITGFMGSIGSSGFDPSLDPLYRVISKVLSGFFGETFALKLFSEGPFFFTLFMAFMPVMIYLAFSSLYKFGMEKHIGAIELITYGPADGSCCVIASVIKNILLTGIFLIGLLVFFSIAALLNNLVLGPAFFLGLFLIFFVALAIYSYMALIMVITENASSGIALFLFLFLFFGVFQFISFSIIFEHVNNLASGAGTVVSWFSPFFYWNNGLTLVEYGQVSGYFMNIIFLLILSSVLLYASHLIIQHKGVRG